MATAALAACGGGANTVPSVGTDSVDTVIATTAGLPQSIALPAADGFSGTLTLTPALSVNGVTAQISDGTSPPAGTPTLSNGDTALFYVGVVVSSQLALESTPAFTFTLPATVTASNQRARLSGAPLQIDIFDPTTSAGYQAGAACTQSGTAVTCPGSNTPTTLAAHVHYAFALGERGASGGDLTVTVPTPAPVACSPATVTVLLDQTAVIVCGEVGYGGAFSATSANPSIATISQSNNLTYDYFTVTGVAAGSTTVTLQSAAGPTTAVTVTVAP